MRGIYNVILLVTLCGGDTVICTCILQFILYAIIISVYVLNVSYYYYYITNVHERLTAASMFTMLYLPRKKMEQETRSLEKKITSKMDEVDNKMDEMAKQLNDLKSILEKIAAPGQ